MIMILNVEEIGISPKLADATLMPVSLMSVSLMSDSRMRQTIKSFYLFIYLFVNVCSWIKSRCESKGKTRISPDHYLSDQSCNNELV